MTFDDDAAPRVNIAEYWRAFESDSEVSNFRTQVFQVLNPFDEVQLFVETSGNDQLQWTTGKATEKNDPFDKFEKRLLFRRMTFSVWSWSFGNCWKKGNRFKSEQAYFVDFLKVFSRTVLEVFSETRINYRLWTIQSLC